MGPLNRMGVNTRVRECSAAPHWPVRELRGDFQHREQVMKVSLEYIWNDCADAVRIRDALNVVTFENERLCILLRKKKRGSSCFSSPQNLSLLILAFVLGGCCHLQPNLSSGTPEWSEEKHL